MTASFTLLLARYDRGSIFLTSNKGFAKWSELQGDTVIADVIQIHRLHDANLVNIRRELQVGGRTQAGLDPPSTT